MPGGVGRPKGSNDKPQVCCAAPIRALLFLQTSLMHNNTNTHAENLPGRISDKRRKVKLPRYSQLTKQTIAHFDNFVESTSPLRLSHELRDLFLLHLSYKDSQPDKLHELSADLYFLLQFLDRVGEEMQGKIVYWITNCMMLKRKIRWETDFLVCIGIWNFYLHLISRLGNDPVRGHIFIVIHISPIPTHDPKGIVYRLILNICCALRARAHMLFGYLLL